jgi:rhodanese-related sulfurtransferase
MKLITRAELKDRMASWPDLKLVFVLGEWQYRAMHIPGSLNVPCSPSLYSGEDALRDLQPDDEIVIYCSGETCYASISVYHLLAKRGYRNVSRYAGGLVDWKDAGYPLQGEMVMPQAASAAS